MILQPWCGSCKKLAPQLDELAKLHGDKMHVAKIDVTKYSELAAIYGITSYPTIKYFYDGNVYDYNGDRSIDSFIVF